MFYCCQSISQNNESLITYVTLYHKTSHKGHFFSEIKIYALYESWINSFPLIYGLLEKLISNA